MSLQTDVNEIKKILLREAPPELFSFKDVARSFFGALFLGFAMLSKLLVELAPNLKNNHVLLIIIFTIIILTMEIYFIGYARLTPAEKKTRYFGEFWTKRFVTFYVVAILVSVLLVWIYNINSLLPAADNFKLIVSLSMPCAIGAATADLLRKY